MINRPTCPAALVLKRAAVLVFVLLLVHSSFGKRKDDVVVMNNGDKFTGEIKALEFGELIFKADHMKDSVHLDWRQVATLQTMDTFIVGLSDGKRVSGFISKEVASGKNSKDSKILAEGIDVDVSPADVITIGQREVSFWNQLNGSISYSFSFASGNKGTSSSLAADVAFHTAKNSIQLATSSQFDSQTNAKNTNRFTFDSQYGRMLTKQWLAAGLFSLLKSN